MRQCITLVLFVGCSLDCSGDDGQPPLHPPPGQDDDDDEDREECDLATAAGCPRGWGFMAHSGPGASDDGPMYVELEDIGEHVCNGRGVYADPESLQNASAIAGVTIVRNSRCFIACMPECALGSVCWAERPDGQQCGSACMVPTLDRAECIEFVAECLGEDAATCEG